MKQAKEYLDQVGALKSTLTDIEQDEPYDKRPLFCEGPTQRGNRPEEGAEDPSIKSKFTNREQGTSGGGHSNPRTEQYTHNSQCKNAMPKYKCHSVSDSCNGDNTPNHTSKSSGSAGTLSIKLGKNNKGLNTVNGYEIEFSLKPRQTQKPYPAQLNQTQQELVSQEIKDMISKGAVTELQTLPVGRFLSTLFLVPKKDGGQRPVINLKKLNSFINAPHFKMEGIHTLKSLLQKGDWLVKIYLKDAYFSVLISKEQRKFLCFPGFTSSTVSLSAWPQPHQDLKADSSSRSGAGDTDDSLHR